MSVTSKMPTVTTQFYGTGPQCFVGLGPKVGVSPSSGAEFTGQAPLALSALTIKVNLPTGGQRQGTPISWLSPRLGC